MKKWLCAALALSLLLTACAAVSETAPVKVTVLVAEALGDRSFNDSANEGLQALIADFGVDGKVVECKNDASKFLPALADAADESQVIVAVGWQFWEALEQVVPEYPDKQFVFIDNPLAIDGCANLVSIVYADNQGSFLAGYIAMKLSKTGKVGVVGGNDDDTINNFVAGYRQGALYANPQGAVLDPIYTNGNYDAPDLGKEAALSLYSQGADVVFPVAGKTGLGVFEAAAETGNFALGVDSDQKYINPDVILCSMLKQVGASDYDAIARYLTDGVFEGGQIWDADMSTGLVSIGYGDDTMTQQVTPELKAEVEALKEKIISGEIVVDSTR